MFYTSQEYEKKMNNNNYEFQIQTNKYALNNSDVVVYFIFSFFNVVTPYILPTLPS